MLGCRTILSCGLRKAYSLGIGLGILLFLAGCGLPQQPPGSSVLLADLFPLARLGFVVCAPATAGDIAFRSHLGTGLRPSPVGDEAFSDSDQSLEALRFFLYEPRAVRIDVQARSLKGGRQRELLFSLGESTQTVRLEPRMTLRFPANQVSAGLNVLHVSQARDIAWSKFAVYPAEAVDSSVSGTPLMPHQSADRSEILLSFGQTVDFPLELGQRSTLEVELSPWVEAGAPPLGEGVAFLEVTLKRDGQPEVREALRGPRLHKLPLPAGSGRVALQLRAACEPSTALLPGQMGLALGRARVWGGSAPAEVVAAPVASPPSKMTTAERPNIVLYLVDTLRADRLSLYGCPHPTSPYLDALAGDGVTFDQVCAQSPWTKPSVASVLTGLEPRRHGVHDFQDALPQELTTWAELLEPNGYQNFAFVANGLVGERFGFDQGFSHYPRVAGVESSAVLVDKAIAALQNRDAARPFFLYLQPIDPHLPYAPPSEWIRRSVSWHGLENASPSHYPRLGGLSREGFSHLTHELFCAASSGLDADLDAESLTYLHALYDGEVAFGDAAFGRLVEWLKAEGLYDNTMIVFTSDHGEELLERGWLGHVHSLNEELIRVPLVMKFPDSLYAGQRPSEVYRHIDILPTVASALGFSGDFDGIAYPSAPARAFFEVNAGRDAAEARQATVDYLEAGAGVRQREWKLTHRQASIKPADFRALFDLDADPGEQRNRILDFPVKALFLEASLARHRAGTAGVVAPKVKGKETEALLRTLDYLR